MSEQNVALLTSSKIGVEGGHKLKLEFNMLQSPQNVEVLRSRILRKVLESEECFRD